MTSFAFLLGVLPLAAAEGAASELRQALGTAVFTVMLGVTMFGLILTPTFYVVLRYFFRPLLAAHGGIVLRGEMVSRALKEP